METIISEPMMPSSHLEIDSEEAAYLKETAGWAKFLAIVGLVFCGLIVVLAFFMNSVLSSIPNLSGTPFPMQGVGIMFTIIYLLLALLYFFPCYYLLNFATKMKNALLRHDQILLKHSLSNLKSCFKFFGIMTLVVIGFYALILIAVGIGMAVGLSSFGK
ncbi:MAG TPA: DUF5362 family protein [Chitinophagales bacterium]|nr:DUF5362 family protein [Chitinophagales bacterium]